MTVSIQLIDFVAGDAVHFVPLGKRVANPGNEKVVRCAKQQVVIDQGDVG